MVEQRSHSVSTAELAVEVQRLKSLINLRTSPRCAGDLESEPSVDHSVPKAIDQQVARYGDLEVHCGQTVHYDTGDTYEGQTLGKLQHGTGRLTCANGDIYTGQWQYGRRDGQGHAVFDRHQSADGDQPKPVCYDGQWKDDRTLGEGTCTYEDGAVYTGDWLQDQRSGWGRHTFHNQDWYEGEWEGDTMQGQGRLTLTDGSYYECSWKEGQPLKGKWCAADGKTEYEGQFKGMVWHGFGIMHKTGVKKYMGQWHEGVEHGHGQCITADGAVYDGQWARGSRCGQGRMSRGDKYQYSGQWLHDLPHGQGQCRLSDGSKYVGDWQAGNRHGKGRCLFASGDQYDGDWKKDARHGSGGCMYASGDKYKGTWRHDKRHGQGVCLFADGTKFKGEWEDDAWLQSAADPVHSQVQGLADALAGQQASFSIQAHDELRNKRLNGGDDFRVRLVGPGGHETHASVEDQENGTYNVTYNVTAAGDHDVHVSIGDEEGVADSPYTLRVLPLQPVPRHSTVSGAGRKRATAGEPAEFYVDGRDQYGNRCKGDVTQLMPVSVEVSCKPFVCSVSVTPTDDGRYQCMYTPDRPGFYRLEVTSKGIHLCGSPFSVQVADSTCGLAGSSFSAKQARALQQPSTAADICRPLVDSVKAWENIAAAEYGFDGVMEGWEGDSKQAAENSEDKFLQAHPDVPVVENLEDIWLVNRLQQERKARERELQQSAQQQQRREVLQRYTQAMQNGEQV